MSERNWKLEAHENLQDFERRQSSVWHNPSLARLYMEWGVAVAVVVVFTCYGSTLRAIGPDGRNVFFVCSIVGAVIALALASIGIAGVANQRWQRLRPPRRNNDPSAVGW